MTALVLSTTLAVAAQPDNKADEEFAKKLNAARENAVRYLKTADAGRPLGEG